MIPIYIIHYYKLHSRREYLKNILQGHFVTRYCPEMLSHEEKQSYKADPELWKVRCEDMYQEIPPFSPLKEGMVSCSIGHREVLKHISRNHDQAIILEDDAILNGNIADVNSTLNVLINTAPKNWDVLFLGGAFPHTVAPSKGFMYPWICKGHPASNTVCAYAVTKKSAGKLAESLEAFTLPIDFEFNYAMKKNDMSAWHLHPYFFLEGSSRGIYKTSQDR